MKVFGVKVQKKSLYAGLINGMPTYRCFYDLNAGKKNERLVRSQYNERK